ncbi:MAG: quinol:cytochrome C oxidoreductase [Myxococcota bacterium]
MAHAHQIEINDADVIIPEGHKLMGAPRIALGLGAVGLLATFGLGAMDLGHFYFSYLTAFMFWLSISLGALGFVVIHHTVRAGWSVVVRRLAEHLMTGLPVLGLLFIPILVGLFVPGAHGDQETWLFHWTHAPGDAIVEHKSGYLNTTAFIIRAAVCFGLWFVMVRFYRAKSISQDTSAQPEMTREVQWWGPLGAMAFALTLTIASIDWMMSLDPHWYSTIFGVYYFAGAFMSVNAVLALMCMWLQKHGMLNKIVTVEHYHDLGKYVWAFMIFWAYVGFSQYMLIWYANIPEETMWYGYRLKGTWFIVSCVLAIGHFALPFFAMMSRHIKRSRKALMVGATWMLCMQWLDMYWLIQPVLTHHHGSYDAPFSIMDITAFIGIGGIVMGVILKNVMAAPLIPVKDPRIQESLAFENF